MLIGCCYILNANSKEKNAFNIIFLIIFIYISFKGIVEEEQKVFVNGGGRRGAKKKKSFFGNSKQ